MSAAAPVWQGQDGEEGNRAEKGAWEEGAHPNGAAGLQVFPAGMPGKRGITAGMWLRCC